MEVQALRERIDSPRKVMPPQFTDLVPAIAEAEILPGGSVEHGVYPQSQPYIKPEYCLIIAMHAADLSKQESILVRGIDCSQTPLLISGNNEHYITSEMFAEPPGLKVDWPTISALGLGRELRMKFENQHGIPIRVHIEVWGIPCSNLDSNEGWGCVGSSPKYRF